MVTSDCGSNIDENGLIACCDMVLITGNGCYGLVTHQRTTVSSIF